MSESLDVDSPSRRWIPITILCALAIGLIAAIVSIAVGENRVEDLRIDQTGEVQQLIAGIPQLDERLGEDDAAVTVNLFLDIQCQSCADYMASVIDPFIADYVRTGRAKILLRHRPLGTKPVTLGSFGTIAANQQDRGWQYAEIFARNLDQVPELGVDQDFLDEIAGVTPKLEVQQWQEDVADPGIQALAQDDDELAASLKLPGETTLIVENSASGESVQLDRSPSLAELTATVEQLGG